MSNAESMLNDLRSKLRSEKIEVVEQDERLGESPADGSTKLRIDFSLQEFESALATYAADSASLWPDRAKDQGSLQLMLVHIDEELDRMPVRAGNLRFDARGYIIVVND